MRDSPLPPVTRIRVTLRPSLHILPENDTQNGLKKMPEVRRKLD
jgi:hypothetical protein